LVISIKITNVLNRKNIFFHYWDMTQGKLVSTPGYGIFPVGGIQVAF